MAMLIENSLKLVFGFLGGGMIATLITTDSLVGFLGGGGMGGMIASVITITAQRRASRRSVERKHLNSCLRHLYAPVVQLLQDSEMALNRLEDVQQVSKDEFGEKSWSDESAHNRAMVCVDDMTAIGNEYAAIMRSNLAEIVKIAGDYRHLVDVRDMEVFDDIRRQNLRLRIEHESSKDKITRGHSLLLLTMKSGGVSFFKPDWLKAIEESYSGKMKRYRQLAGLEPIPISNRHADAGDLLPGT